MFHDRMSRTRAHLDRIVIAIRECDAQLAARGALLEVFRDGGHATGHIERAIALKTIERVLLALRRDEAAGGLLPASRGDKAA